MAEIPTQPDWVTKIADTHMFIGHLATEWNKMEYTMAFVAAPLMGTTIPKARITLYAMNPPARRDYLYALIAEGKWGETELGKKLTALVDEFERLRKLRNDIVHGRWNFNIDAATDKTTPMLTVTRGRSEPKEVTTEEDTKNIIKVINDIQALTGNNISLGQEFAKVLEAMRRERK